MKIGYARVSTTDQDLSIQIEKLQTAGCEKIYKEKGSGLVAIDLNSNDVLVIFVKMMYWSFAN